MDQSNQLIKSTQSQNNNINDNEQQLPRRNPKRNIVKPIKYFKETDFNESVTNLYNSLLNDIPLTWLIALSIRQFHTNKHNIPLNLYDIPTYEKIYELIQNKVITLTPVINIQKEPNSVNIIILKRILSKLIIYLSFAPFVIENIKPNSRIICKEIINNNLIYQKINYKDLIHKKFCQITNSTSINEFTHFFDHRLKLLTKEAKQLHIEMEELPE